MYYSSPAKCNAWGSHAALIERKRVPVFFAHLLFSRPLLLALSIVAVFSAPAYAGLKKEDHTKTEQRKIFLLRSGDEISWALIFANEAVDILTEQMQAAGGREPEIKVDGRGSMLKWHRRYADWLAGISNNIQTDLAGYYSGKRTTSWMTRSQNLESGSRKLIRELSGILLRLEGERSRIDAHMQKLETAVEERRLLINRRNLKLAREVWPGTYRKSYRARRPFYRTLSDDNILYLRDVVSSLEDQQKYYDVFIELGKYERDWLNIKARDFSKLAALGRAIRRNDQSGTLRASRSAVRTYNGNIVALMKRLTEIETKLESTPNTGSIKNYERIQEQSRYYEMFKSRFERQIEWYTGQIESYQSDFDALRKKNT